MLWSLLGMTPLTPPSLEQTNTISDLKDKVFGPLKPTEMNMCGSSSARQSWSPNLCSTNKILTTMTSASHWASKLIIKLWHLLPPVLFLLTPNLGVVSNWLFPIQSLDHMFWFNSMEQTRTLSEDTPPLMDRLFSFQPSISWVTFTPLTPPVSTMTAQEILMVTLALSIMMTTQSAVDSMRLLLSTLLLSAAPVEVDLLTQQEDNLNGEDCLPQLN